MSRGARPPCAAEPRRARLPDAARAARADEPAVLRVGSGSRAAGAHDRDRPAHGRALPRHDADAHDERDGARERRHGQSRRQLRGPESVHLRRRDPRQRGRAAVSGEPRLRAPSAEVRRAAVRPRQRSDRETRRILSRRRLRPDAAHDPLHRQAPHGEAVRDAHLGTHQPVRFRADPAVQAADREPSHPRRHLDRARRAPRARRSARCDSRSRRRRTISPRSTCVA